jgi:hypothetical protein
MQVLGIPRSGFSLIMNALDNLIIWDYEQRGELESINLLIGQEIFKNFFSSLPKTSRKIWSGEFDYLTGGPKILDERFYKVRKYIGFINQGDIVFEVYLNKKLMFLNHIFHSHYFNINEQSNQPTLISNRNPCGIFESAIHSLNAMTSEYIQKIHPEYNSEKIEDIRNDMALYKFSRSDVVSSLMNFQVNESKQMISYISSTNNNEIIDWEALILKESGELLKIYDFLRKNHIKVHDFSKSREIFYKNINKNLLRFHKHNFRTGHALRDGWIFGLPYSLSKKLTDMAKKIDKNILFKDYQKHIKNLNLSKDLLHNHGKMVDEILKNKNVYYSDLMDSNIKEFSMNKSNLNAADLDDDYICDLEIGLVNIKKMSRELEYLIPSFELLNNELKKLNEVLDQKRYSLYECSVDLTSNLENARNLMGELKLKR